MGEDSSRDVAELLQVLGKSAKALRLYRRGNEIVRRLEEELLRRLEDVLDRHGEVRLAVREQELLFEDEVVEHATESDGLPAVLFRDGIRSLAFLPGVRRDEVEAFLDAFNRVRSAEHADEDLVTILWEHDLQGIRYVAVDELPDEALGPRVSEAIVQPFTGAGSGSGGGTGVLALEEIPRTVAHVPVEDCRLSEEESETILAEIARDEALDHPSAAVRIAIDLALLEPDDEHRQTIGASLGPILRRLAADEAAAVVAATVELDRLVAEVAPDDARLIRLRTEVLADLGRPQHVGPILGRLRDPGRPPGAVLERFLRLLGPAALPAIAEHLPQLVAPEHRAAAHEALAAGGEAAVRALSALLDPPDPILLREAVPVLRRLPGDAANHVLRRLLAAPDAEVRRLALRGLPGVEDPAARPSWLQALTDPDSGVRGVALGELVRSGRVELLPHVTALVDAEGFADWPTGEKRRLFGAVARLGGEDAVPFFRQLLQPGRRRILASRTTRETLRAAVYGLRTIASPAAREVLEEIADGPVSWLRQASRGLADGEAT